jgi:hypothetical protein
MYAILKKVETQNYSVKCFKFLAFVQGIRRGWMGAITSNCLYTNFSLTTSLSRTRIRYDRKVALKCAYMDNIFQQLSRGNTPGSLKPGMVIAQYPLMRRA